jgi:hypothetical protein
LERFNFLTNYPQPSFQDDVALFSQEIKKREQSQKSVLDEINVKLDDDIKKEVLVALE